MRAWLGSRLRRWADIIDQPRPVTFAATVSGKINAEEIARELARLKRMRGGGDLGLS